MNKKVKKGMIITAIVIGSIIALLLLLYAILWIIRACIYSDAIDARRYVCDIPELGSGYVPQGVCYSDDQSLYLLSGYEDSGKKSYVVVFSVKNNKPTRIKLADSNGKPLEGHGGGIACTKDYVYIANERYLEVYSLGQMLEAGKSGKRVNPLRSKPVDVRAAFVFTDDDSLYVGEFYRAGNYETNKAHHYKTPAGDKNKALITHYPLDETGSVADYPDYSISVTELVQGFAVSDGTFILSRSWGLANSKLEYYGALKTDGATVTLTYPKDTLEDIEVPLYYLDKTNKTKTLSLPPFSEDLDIVNGRVVVTNEAACNKYFIGKLFGATKVYSYPIYK